MQPRLDHLRVVEQRFQFRARFLFGLQHRFHNRQSLIRQTSGEFQANAIRIVKIYRPEASS